MNIHAGVRQEVPRQEEAVTVAEQAIVLPWVCCKKSSIGLRVCLRVRAKHASVNFFRIVVYMYFI